MFEGEDIAFSGLEVCSYRHLQTMAKNMGLPSNVKKVHLIEMIRAKKYCTDTDLKAIVERVKMERKVNSQAKKKKQKRKTFRIQGTEVSSTSNSQSPPIKHTPKRPSDFVIQYSPDITRTIMKFQPRPNIFSTRTSILQPLKRHIESDRVLRSFNSVKRPNYRIMEQNDCAIGVVNAQNSMQELRQESFQEVRQDAYGNMNVAVPKHRPVMVMNQDRQLVPVSRSSNITKPAKRQRKLSGIYPLQPLENSLYDYEPTVGFRHPDGRLTKINAILQRPLSSSLLPKKKALVQKKVARVTVQDVINYKVNRSSNDIGKTLEGSRLYEIDYSNENGLYNECPTDEIAEVSNFEADSQPFSHETLNATKTIVLEPNQNMILENSRKVYKGCQRVKTVNKGWNYSIEYQEHDNPGARKEWNVYDINDQSIDRFENTGQTKKLHERNIQCHTHKAKEIPEPISTNYKVKQGRITEPISRDYQVEYQKFNQGFTTNVNHARSDRNDSRQEIVDRNINNARTNIINQLNQEITVDKCGNKDQFNQEIVRRNLNIARTGSGRQINHEITIKYAQSGTNQFNQGMNNVRHTEQQFKDTTDCNVVTSGVRNQWTDKETYRNINQLKPITKDHYNKDTADKNTNQKCDIDASSKYPNMASLTDVFPNEDYSQEIMDRQNSNYSVYYHKKIRAEHVKTQKESFEKLPRINDVFSQFNDVQYKCLTQPLYVQVSKESERVLPLPRVVQTNNINNTCMLESIYNFKNQFIMNPPVLLIATTQTQCTYSTKTVSTAVAQPAADYYNNINPYERANPYQPTETPRLYEYLKPEFMPRYSFSCNEVLSSSTASLDTTNTQDLGANVTIPEMVEDALELISQDGDYMERIGMDVRMQCIQCDWAGPKIILEYHIKKDHSHQIQHEVSDEWKCIFTLGELVSCHTWHSRLLQRGESVLALSAKYTTTDDIQVALSMIPTEPEITKHARITVYNKISGQPYTHEGEIKHLPDSMPYEYGLECLEVDIGKLDLIPNSANLRLVNRELVGSSGVVVVGQPELNRVEIAVYVKLLD